MTNFEYYKDELAMRGFNFSVDKITGKLSECSSKNCAGCKFCHPIETNGRTKLMCSKDSVIRWLYQKHKIKMNALEYGLLEYMLSEGYEWVSRDDDFTITFFILKPVDKDGTWHSPEKGFDEPLSCVPLCEKLFEFLREDELFEINELLGTCEVTE